MKKSKQCKDIPHIPILAFLKKHEAGWCTHGRGYSMPTVQDAMPEGTPHKLQLAKMCSLVRRGMVDGCTCGCRGDWKITAGGEAHLLANSYAGPTWSELW